MYSCLGPLPDTSAHTWTQSRWNSTEIESILSWPLMYGRHSVCVLVWPLMSADETSLPTVSSAMEGWAPQAVQHSLKSCTVKGHLRTCIHYT